MFATNGAARWGVESSEWFPRPLLCHLEATLIGLKESNVVNRYHNVLIVLMTAGAGRREDDRSTLFILTAGTPRGACGHGHVARHPD